MGQGLIATLLIQLITHLIEYMMKKDTATLTAEELVAHDKDLACLHGMCGLAKQMH
jgi:hypothetical protein